MNKNIEYNSEFDELCTERDMLSLKHANGWVGMDLDGTLAEYHGWVAPNVIGPPIPAMLSKVKAMLKAGIKVKIFTARGTMNAEDASIAIPAIHQWCIKFLGEDLEVTNVKDVHMIRLYDDRAFQVRPNLGTIVKDIQ